MCQIEGQIPVSVLVEDPEPIRVRVNLVSDLPPPPRPPIQPPPRNPRERGEDRGERPRRSRRPRVWHIVAITVGLALATVIAYAIYGLQHPPTPVVATPPVTTGLPPCSAECDAFIARNGGNQALRASCPVYFLPGVNCR